MIFRRSVLQICNAEIKMSDVREDDLKIYKAKQINHSVQGIKLFEIWI